MKVMQTKIEKGEKKYQISSFMNKYCMCMEVLQQRGCKNDLQISEEKRKNIVSQNIEWKRRCMRGGVGKSG